MITDLNRVLAHDVEVVRAITEVAANAGGK